MRAVCVKRRKKGMGNECDTGEPDLLPFFYSLYFFPSLLFTIPPRCAVI